MYQLKMGVNMLKMENSEIGDSQGEGYNLIVRIRNARIKMSGEI